MESNIDELLTQYEEEMQRNYEQAMENSNFLEEIQNMDNTTFLKKMTEEEYHTIIQKENLSNIEQALIKKYEEAMEEKIQNEQEEDYRKQIQKEVEKDFEQYGKYQEVGEGEITIYDHQKLAEAVYKTLWNPRNRFSLQLSPKSKKRMEIPSRLDKIILEKAEWTREKLLSSHQDLVSGLNALIEYNTKNGFPTKTGQRFMELQKFLKDHDFDKSDWDLFKTYVEKYANKELTSNRKDIGLGKHARVSRETQGVETNIGGNDTGGNGRSARGTLEHRRGDGSNEERTNKTTTELTPETTPHQEPVSRTDISAGEKQKAKEYFHAQFDDATLERIARENRGAGEKNDFLSNLEKLYTISEWWGGMTFRNIFGDEGAKAIREMALKYPEVVKESIQERIEAMRSQGMLYSPEELDTQAKKFSKKYGVEIEAENSPSYFDRDFRTETLPTEQFPKEAIQKLEQDGWKRAKLSDESIIRFKKPTIQVMKEVYHEQIGTHKETILLKPDKQNTKTPETKQEPTPTKQETTKSEPLTANNKETKTNHQIERKSITKGSTTNLQDVGEKIGGARKDLYALLGKVDLDIAYTETDIEKLPATKVIPNPDWNALIQTKSISKEDIPALITLRAKVATKPRMKYKKAEWAKSVLFFRKELQQALDGKGISPALRAFERDNIELHTKLDTLNNPMYGKYHIRKTVVYQKGEQHTGYNLFFADKRGGFFESIEEIIQAIQKREQQEQEQKVAETKGVAEESLETFSKYLNFYTDKENIYFLYKKGSKEIIVASEPLTGKAWDHVRKHLKNDDTLRTWQQTVVDLQALDETLYKTETLEAIHSTTDRKEGENITAERFQKTFGLRGVEFGNWLNSRERQERVNQVYDAFMDLAHILSMKPEGIGLNGQLGFAFGSRGRKGAMAHYEREKVVINLTKKDGYGSVAHEWWHAFDNYLRRVDTGSTYASDFATDTLYKKNPGLGKHIQLLMKKLKELGIQKRSQNLDKLKGKKYYTQPTEMGARAFESWIEYKLQQEGRKNGMLVSLNPERSQDDPYNPYATGDELTKLDPLWQDLWNSKKETNNGKVVYYMSKKSTGIGGAEEINDKEIQKNPQEAENKKSLGVNDATPMTKKESIRGKEPSLIDSHMDMITDFQKNANKFVKIEGDTAFYIKEDGTKIEYSKPESMKIRDWRKWQFKTSEIFDVKNLWEKVELLGRVQLGKINEGIIALIDNSKLIITSGMYEKFFKKHGPFSNENMIAVANNWDFYIENRGGVEGHINLIKKFKDHEGGVLLGAKKSYQDEFFTSTHYEPTGNIYDIIQKELDKGAIIWTRQNGVKTRITHVSQIRENVDENNANNSVFSLKNSDKNSNELDNETNNELKYSDITLQDLTKPKYAEKYKKNVAKNKKELLQKIDNLNKLAMSTGVMRKIGDTGNVDALGRLDPWQNKKTKGNEARTQNTLGVKIRKEVHKLSDEYMSVLAHELGHALEWQLFGEWDTHTIEIFGENLSEETQQKVWDELKRNTLDMEGVGVVAENMEYYYRPTELLARFIQKWFDEPMILNEVAPTAMELFTRQAVHHPIIGEYLEAIQGKIDEKQTKLGVEVLMDMKHRLQYSLGERAGTKAYETITRRNAMIARGKEVFGKELEKKFKGVKNKELLYETIEATLETRNGEPVFGTRDFMEIVQGRYKEYNQEGWSRAENQEGVEEGMVRMWNWRYTESEGKQLWEQLNEKEKQIVREFTAPADEAVDFFNRNKIAERYGIENQIEGWIHRFWKDDGWRNSGIGGKKLGDKKAGSRKERTHEQGYVKDMQKALYKSLVELESEEYFNNWLREFIPRVTQPLADGERAKKGWIEVEGDFVTGFLLRGQRNEYRVTDKGTFKIQKGKYQMPLWIYDAFTDIAGILEERGQMYAIADIIANMWQINVLTHPGTAVTNGISGGLQFSLKILKNTYDAILSGDARIVWRNFEALFGAIKDWNDTPNWMWGGDDSTYNRDVGKQKYDGKTGKVHDMVGKVGNVVLKPMQLFEEYWKKVIARSSGSFAVSHLNKMTKDGLPPLEISDKEALSMIQDMVDLYGYDYENVPMWLNKLSKNPIGKLTLPFKRYMYKYFTMIAEHTFIPILDKNMPMKERIARVMGFATWLGLFMAIYGAFGNDDKENRDNPNLPKYMNNRGKLKIGEDEEGNEKWVRLVKYPGFNLIGYGQAMGSFAKGDVEKGFDNLGTAINASTDGWNTMGPLSTAIAGQFGLTNEFDQHKTNAQKSASVAVQFVPGFRIWQDLAQITDPYKRKTEKPWQEFTRLIPFVSEDMQEVLRGSIRYDNVPMGNKSIEKIPRKSYPEDVALSLITGIYTSRVNPEIVERYMQRYENNQIEKTKKEEKKNEEILLLEKYKEYDGNFWQIKAKIGNELGNKSTDEKRRVTRLAKQWMAEVKYKDNDWVQKIYKARDSEDKKNFLEAMKGEMNTSEYRKVIKDLKDAGIIPKK